MPSADSSESRIQRELLQSKPFATLQAEALVNIVRTADQLQRRIRLCVKPFGITQTQFNSLRILRGAGERGLTCAEVGERLITHDPDITRLLNRMERQGLVRRDRDTGDRRVVVARITQQGLEKLRTLDEVVEATVTTLLAKVDDEELRSLIRLLERTRDSLQADKTE